MRVRNQFSRNRTANNPFKNQIFSPKKIDYLENQIAMSQNLPSEPPIFRWSSFLRGKYFIRVTRIIKKYNFSRLAKFEVLQNLLLVTFFCMNLVIIHLLSIRCLYFFYNIIRGPRAILTYLQRVRTKCSISDALDKCSISQRRFTSVVSLQDS